MPTFTQQVTVSGDDGCWSVATPSPYFSTNSTMLRVGDGSSTDFDRSVWFRFPGVTIPKGAVISSATLTLVSGGFTAPPPPMAVKVEAADNAAQITSRTDVLARTRAAGTTAWAPATWPASGSTVTSPNFATTLQQVTDRAGWVSGNAVQLFLEDTSAGFVAPQQVSIQPQEGATAGQGATLNVTYTVPVGYAADAGPDQGPVPSLATVQLTSAASTGSPTKFAWSIVSGGGILSSTTVANPTLKAPATIDGTTVVLSLQVGTTVADSTPDTVQVTVRPHTLWRVDATGPQPVTLNAV